MRAGKLCASLSLAGPLLASPTTTAVPATIARWKPHQSQSVWDLEIVYGKNVPKLFNSSSWNPWVHDVDVISPESTYTVPYVTSLPAAARSAAVQWRATSTNSMTTTMLLHIPSSFAPNFIDYPADAQNCLVSAAEASNCQGRTMADLNMCLCSDGGSFVTRSAQCLVKEQVKDIKDVYKMLAQLCGESGTPLIVSEADFTSAVTNGDETKKSPTASQLRCKPTASPPPRTTSDTPPASVAPSDSSSDASSVGSSGASRVSSDASSTAADTSSSGPPSSAASSATPGSTPDPNILGIVGKLCQTCRLVQGSASQSFCQCDGIVVNGDLNEHVWNDHGTMKPGAGGNFANSCTNSGFSDAAPSFILTATCAPGDDSTPPDSTLDIGPILNVVWDRGYKFTLVDSK